MPTSVKLGSIQGYALVAPAVAVKVGGVQGYALVRTPNTPNFTLSGKAALLAGMNKQYKSAFIDTQVSFDPPQALVNDPDYNSSVLLRTNRTSGYSGTKTMRYNRVDFALAMVGKDSTLPTTGMGSTVFTSLAAINTKYGLALSTDDVIDAPISGGGVTIVAANTSWLYLPGTTMRIGSQIPTMAQAFPQVEIFAF